LLLIPLQILAFFGAGGEPPRRKRLWGLTCPLLPQESRTSAPKKSHNQKENRSFEFGFILIMAFLNSSISL
jgi:hypothetical protein